MPLGRVIVRAILEQHDIRLRLRVVTEPNRILDADNGFSRKVCDEQRVRPIHAGDMPVPDRTHLDDLAFDEFHARILIEDAGVRHPVILINRKELPGNFGLHVTSCLRA